MKKSIVRFLIALAVLIAGLAPAEAQWQVPAHAVPIGRGAGVTGFNSAGAATAGRILIDQGAGADPAFEVLSGSCTITAAGVISCSGSSGTVTTVSIVSANGFAGTVANATTTPAITLTTTINGLVKGNATSLSAATAGTDYSAGTSGLATGFVSSTTGTGALATVGSSGSGSVCLTTSCVMVTPQLGTPTSGVLTNATGLPVSSGISGLGTGIATWLGTPSSANLAAALTDETGSVAAVFSTSPTLVTPVLGVATATSINKTAITAPATSSTLAVADGKTLTASNTLTLAATDGQTWTFPASSSNVLTTGNTATITKGYTLTANNIGTVSSGTTTLDCTAGNYQYLTDNGAFTLAAMSSDCAMDVLITNGASAGTITFSGFTIGASTGDAFTTTNTNKFLLSVVRINGTATWTNKALQ